MCKEEAVKSITDNRPHFVNRYKWFSPSLEFVTSRVQDGVFNNSGFRPGRYTELLAFMFTDSSVSYFVFRNEKEYMLDRRDTPMVRCERCYILGRLSDDNN